MSEKDGNSKVATNMWGTKGSEIVNDKTSEQIGCNESIASKSSTDVMAAGILRFSKEG